MDKTTTAKDIQAIFIKGNDKPLTKVSTKDSTTYLYRLFSIAGVYRPEKHKNVFILLAIFIHFWVTLFLPSSFIGSYFIESSKDFEYDTLLSSIQVAINVLGSSAKIITLLYYVPHLKTAEPVMAELDARCKEEDEIKLLHKLKNLGNSLVAIFVATYLGYTSFTFIASILAGHPPYSLYLPYINWRNTNWEFIVSSIIECILIDVACFQNAANDAYAPIYVCILRTHVNILRMRIRKLCTKPNITLKQNENELIMCIKDHKKIIELYNIIAPVISTTIFIQFALTAGVLSITLINIIIFAKNFSTKLASCFYVLAVVTETAPLCYYANCLSYDSDRLCEDIFHSQWVHQNVRYRKMMILFIQRTQQTMILLAGKVFPIDLNSFISIAKFSMSLYTLLKKMNIKEKLGVQ